MQKYSLTHNTLEAKAFYGIQIETENGDIYEYRYISAFSEEANELIQKMERDYISPLHFNDIISDHLADIYYSRLRINGLIQ